VLISLFKQEEQGSVFVGKFCFSLGQLTWLSIPSNINAAGVEGSVDLSHMNKRAT